MCVIYSYSLRIISVQLVGRRTLVYISCFRYPHLNKCLKCYWCPLNYVTLSSEKIKQNTTMAPVKLKCEVPGCDKETLEVETDVAIKQLQLHHTQFHSLTRKPDKPKLPKLNMSGGAVEDTDYDRFVFQFEQYKQLAGIASNAQEIYHILYNTYGRALTNQLEAQHLVNIRRLVVRQRNTMAAVMSFLKMTQDSDQAILNFIAQLKAAARLCDFKTKCECGNDVDFTDILVLYKIVAGVSDMELQEDLLTKADLTLTKAEKMAVAKESARFSQASMSGDSHLTIRSTSKQLKSGDNPKSCKFCGASKPHKDRKKE
jgi:hypothetical protein